MLRAAGGMPARLWPALVRRHRDLDSRRLGPIRVGDLWPAYLFALPLLARLWGLIERAARGEGAPSLHQQAALLQDLVTTLFLGLIVALFLARRQVVGRRSDWRGALVALTATFLLNLVGLLPVAQEVSTGALLASSVMVVGGTAVTIAGLAALGRCFGILPEVRGLVTRGPYRWVRHPVYLGELVSGVGLLVAKPQPAMVALYALFVVLQYTRTLIEERALVDAFPEEYAAYRSRTCRLVPGARSPVGRLLLPATPAAAGQSKR